MTWIPRKKNAVADGLANEAMDKQESFAWTSGFVCPFPGNIAFFSDGDSRPASKLSAAAWVVVGVVGGQRPTVLAAGAWLLTGDVGSFDAELNGLELAAAVLLSASSSGIFWFHTLCRRCWRRCMTPVQK